MIRRPEYVSGSRERPEVKVFTQAHQTRHPVPWGKLSIGDTVWMKWSGGPIVGKSIVNGFRQIEDCTADELRAATSGSLLGRNDAYFDSLAPRFDAVVIYLGHEQWLDEPITPSARSRGESWVVLGTERLRDAWLSSTKPPQSVSESTGGSKSGHGSRTIPHALRFQVLRRDSFSCVYCGRRAPDVKLHVDHLVPWSKGGASSIENLRTACEACNLGKGASHVLADLDSPARP